MIYYGIMSNGVRCMGWGSWVFLMFLITVIRQPKFLKIRLTKSKSISYYTWDNLIKLTFNSWFKYSVKDVDNCSRNSRSIARQVESDSAEVTAFCVSGKAVDPVMERFSKFGTEDR